MYSGFRKAGGYSLYRPVLSDCLMCVLAGESDLGKVAATVAGISLGVLVVMLIIWLVFRKKEKKKYEEEEAPNEIRWVAVEMIMLLSNCPLLFLKLQHLKRENSQHRP